MENFKHAVQSMKAAFAESAGHRGYFLADGACAAQLELLREAGFGLRCTELAALSAAREGGFRDSLLTCTNLTPQMLRQAADAALVLADSDAMDALESGGAMPESVFLTCRTGGGAQGFSAEELAGCMFRLHMGGVNEFGLYAAPDAPPQETAKQLFETAAWIRREIGMFVSRVYFALPADSLSSAGGILADYEALLAPADLGQCALFTELV